MNTRRFLSGLRPRRALRADRGFARALRHRLAGAGRYGSHTGRPDRRPARHHRADRQAVALRRMSSTPAHRPTPSERRSSCRSAMASPSPSSEREPRVQKDGSVAWVGEVEETGERALLMLWSNALLSGYFAYKGTIYTVESLGGGVHAFAELDRSKLPGDHPPAAARDSVAPTSNSDEAAALRPAPAEPAVAPFADAHRQALEAKSITIDVMMLYSSNAAKYYIRDPADLLALAIEETNETFRRSGLANIKLRLVHSQGDRVRRQDRRSVHPPLHHGRRARSLQGRQEAARRETRRHRRSHHRQPEGLRTVDPRRPGVGRSVLRRASRLRVDHHVDRARDRPHSGCPARPFHGRKQRAVCLWARLRQRQPNGATS